MKYELNKKTLGKKTIALATVLAIVVSTPTIAFAGNTTVKWNTPKEISVVLDGETIDLIENERPIISNGRTMVPLRGILEEMGATVSYQASTKTAKIELNGETIEHKIGTKVIEKDGELYESDTASVLHNNRTMVPIRVISELLGCEVSWDNELKTVFIWNQEGKEQIELSNLDLKLLSFKHANYQNLERYKTVLQMFPELNNDLSYAVSLGNSRMYTDGQGENVSIINPEDYTQAINEQNQVPEGYTPDLVLSPYKDKTDLLDDLDGTAQSIKRDVFPYFESFRKEVKKTYKDSKYSDGLYPTYFNKTNTEHLYYVMNGAIMNRLITEDERKPVEQWRFIPEEEGYVELFNSVNSFNGEYRFSGRVVFVNSLDSENTNLTELNNIAARNGFVPLKKIGRELSRKDIYNYIPKYKETVTDATYFEFVYVGSELANILNHLGLTLDDYSFMLKYYNGESDYLNKAKNPDLIDQETENYKLVLK